MCACVRVFFRRFVCVIVLGYVRVRGCVWVCMSAYVYTCVCVCVRICVRVRAVCLCEPATMTTTVRGEPASFLTEEIML
jgi:hypothetical protein